MKSLRLLHEVRGDFPIGHMTVATAGVYSGDQVKENRLGAVSVLASNGEWLGIKPDEMEWIEQ